MPTVLRPIPPLRQNMALALRPPPVYAPPALRRPSSARPVDDAPEEGEAAFAPDPFVDYGRFLTAEGGILLVYKDIDARLRHKIWSAAVWLLVCAAEAWLLLAHRPFPDFLSLIAWFAAAYLNGLILGKPVEVYRRVEIRPDCLIIEGEEVFFARFMEGNWPSLRPGGDGTLILSGIYGTRRVDYLTLRRFDEFDCAPEIFASHLQAAMEELWNRDAPSPRRARHDRD